MYGTWCPGFSVSLWCPVSGIQGPWSGLGRGDSLGLEPGSGVQLLVLGLLWGPGSGLQGLCSVLSLSVASGICEVMVIGSNSMPAGVLELGCGEEGNVM